MPARRTPLPIGLAQRPFTRREAVLHGIGPDVLRGPGVQTIDRGIFLDADLELTLARRLSGYLQVLPPDTVVDSVTALQLRGVDVGATTPYLFCTTAAHHPRRAAIRVRRVRQLPESRGNVSRSVPALVAARTDLSLLELVTAGDWVIRQKVATPEAVRSGLADVVRRRTGQQGSHAHTAGGRGADPSGTGVAGLRRTAAVVRTRVAASLRLAALSQRSLARSRGIRPRERPHPRHSR